MGRERKQFRILYLDFLYRLIDLDVLAASGDIHRLLAQLAALLAAFSLAVTVMVVPRFALSDLPRAGRAAAADGQIEFMIATTMAVAGLLGLLAWNSVLPDRRDCMILGLLPVRKRTIFFAKLAAIGTALGTGVVATNLFTGLTFPFLALARTEGLFGALRSLAAYWLAVMGAGLLVCLILLAMQGVTAATLSNRRFQQLSGLLQFFAFIVIVGGYFFKPSIGEVHPLAPGDPAGWLPSFWFLGLLQQLRGADSYFTALGVRALWGLAGAGFVAGASFALAFVRLMRSMVEQPDIAPQDRSRPATRMARLLARRFLNAPLDRAIFLFAVRTLARSRQHRLLLAAYGGVGLGTALVYARDMLRGTYISTLWDFVGQRAVKLRWDEPNIPLMAASLILLVFAITGVRAVFPLPIALPANWIFRVTAIEEPADYFTAVRRTLYAIAAVPVWIVSAVFFLAIWPVGPALGHIAALVCVGVLLVERSLREFRKIPFTCSYLPGKGNLNVKLGIWALVFVILADRGVAIEHWAMGDAGNFWVMLVLLAAAATWARRRTSRLADNAVSGVQFEDAAPPLLTALGLCSVRHVVSGEEQTSVSREEEIDEELAFHLRLAAEEYRDRGESPVEAHHSALRQLGNLTRIKEDVRAVWRENSLELLWQDLRIANRGLMKSPLFTGAAVCLIALGVGVNGSVYSLFHSIMQRPMAGVTAKNLVSLGVAVDGREDDPGNSWANYLSYTESAKSFHWMAARGFDRFTIGLEGASYTVRGGLVSPHYFDALGVRPALGRAFNVAAGRGEPSGLTAVISHRLWTEQLEGARDVIGRKLLLNGTPATVIGVAPPKFQGIQLGERMDVWVPIVEYARLHGRERTLTDRGDRAVEIFGQLAAGASMKEAQAELDVISTRLEQRYPVENRRFRALVAPSSAIGPGVQPIRFVLKLLLVVAGLLLLVICANVANLILSRSLGRQREMAVRQSLGAPLSRLVSLLFAEGLEMSVLAAAAGSTLATWATPAIIRLAPGTPPALDLSPDLTVAGYALIQAALATVVFTVLPALSLWRNDPLPSLKSREAAVTPSGKRLLTALTALQLSACVVLLIGAGLLRRSSSMLDAFDTGFRKEGLLLLSVDTGGAAKTASANAKVLADLCDGLRTVPGIQSVSYAVYAPLSWRSMSLGLVKSDPAGEGVRAAYNVVGPDYLGALGASIRLGRDIRQGDRSSSPDVAVVNENLAKELWPGQNPLGRTIEWQGSRRVEVVGVVANGAFSDLRQGSRPNMAFLPFAQQPQVPGQVVFHIRQAEPRQNLISAIRAAIHRVNSQVPIVGAGTAQQRLQETMPLEFVSTLLTIFAAGALVVTGIGLYGLVALNMVRRTREFAVRIALGATSPQIWVEALRAGILLTGVGLAAGLLCSLVGSRVLKSVLFGVSPTDGFTYASVSVVLAMTCFIACLVPAHRATRTDPASVLREE